MNNDKPITKPGTHALCFRISEATYEEFVGLMATVPGSEAGAMYREIFARGLRSLKEFYAEQHRPKGDAADAKIGAAL
jgi:hypothetical protein